MTDSERQRVTRSRRDSTSEVVELRRHSSYRANMASLARGQVAAARQRLDLSAEEFAEVLRPVLGWAPSADLIESWETSVVPPGDVVIAVGVVTQATPYDAGDRSSTDLVAQLIGKQFADVEAVFPTRSEFTSQIPPHALFDDAQEVCAAGLSLNILCQQYADDRLRELIEQGANIRCLFLDPKGEAIRAREQEEDYAPGHLSALTELNIQILLQRVRKRLPDDARQRLQVATYDQTIRFNIILIDRQMAVVQPYLHAARGVESPTLVLRRYDSRAGLFSAFEETFSWLWERSTQV